MAEEKKGGTVGGWVKAGVTSIVGLIGGGILMYVSPLVNNAIKPPKPVANFSQQAQGLTVTFQNRSTGGTEGWWDFGDGSALEPFVSGQQSIVHTYSRPGSYTAKLSLNNFLGDENDRAVAVNLDGSVASAAPTIENFQVVPLKENQSAPAIYRVVGQIKNADLVIWSLGDDRPIEIVNDPACVQDRLVTLQTVGPHVIRLVAVSGKKTAEKAQDVYVAMADKNAPVAELRFAVEAVKVHKWVKSENLAVSFPAKHAGNTFPFKEERQAPSGAQILAAEFAHAVKDAAVKDAKLELSADKTKVTMSGTLVKASGFFNKNAPPPSFSAEVKMTMESRSKAEVKPVDAVAQTLQVPGTTVLPIPAMSSNWTVQRREMQMELRVGKDVLWRESRLPVNALLQINGRPYRVTAIQDPNQVRVEVSAAATVSRPGGK